MAYVRPLYPNFSDIRYSTGLGTKQKAYYQPATVPESNKLAFGDMSTTFTGSDILAVIIRRDDLYFMKQVEQYLSDVQRGVVENIKHFDESEMDLPPYDRYEFDSKIQYSQDHLIPVVNLQTITISTFRSKHQVRAIGHVNPRGVARAGRTIGGTLILTEFDRDTFWQLIGKDHPVAKEDINIGDSGAAVLPDQLAPFDLMLIFANEAGCLAYRMIYGIELVTNGIVYSILDMYNENTLSFLCSDVTPLTPLPPIIVRENALMSEMMFPWENKNVRISPLAAITSGKEVVRRFRLLKNSRMITR